MTPAPEGMPAAVSAPLAHILGGGSAPAATVAHRERAGSGRTTRNRGPASAQSDTEGGSASGCQSQSGLAHLLRGRLARCE
jgi:hypothetical protein